MIGTHALLSALAGPNWLLDTESTDYGGKSEARYLAESAKAVSDHYKPDWLDQKTVDWINFLQAAGAVYGGRLFAIRSERKAVRMGTASPPPPVVRQADVMRQGPVTAPAASSTVNGIPLPRQPLPDGLNLGEVGGMGHVVFPDDHPLMGGPKH